VNCYIISLQAKKNTAYGLHMWVCVCVGFVMCFDNCMSILVICVLFTVFLYCFVYVYLFLFVTSVRTSATE